MRTKGGFTLIEIFVVLIIIGISLGFALLAFGDFGADRRLIISAEQFSTYLKLVQQRAILENKMLGIRITNEGYSTFRLEDNQWKAMPLKGIFHTRKFPADTVVKVHASTKTEGSSPDIIIDAAGDFNRFAIDFGKPQKPWSAVLVGNSAGQLLVQSLKNKNE